MQDYSEPMSGTGSQSLGGVWRLRTTEFSGRRPYRFMGEQESASGLWEMWMDASQALAVRAASRQHENAGWRVRPVRGLRSGDPGQGPSLGERRRVGRYWRWASSPGFSIGRPCDLPGLSGRARIGLCRSSRWFSHLSVSATVVWR